MLKFEVNYSNTLFVSKNDVSNCKLVVNKNYEKLTKNTVKQYVIDTLERIIRDNDISDSIYIIDDLTKGLVCSSFKSNKDEYNIEFTLNNYSNWIMHNICNNFVTCVKCNNKNYYTNKMYTFDYFDIVRVAKRGKNIHLILHSSHFGFEIIKDNNIWYLYQIYDIDNSKTQVDNFAYKLRVIEENFSRFIVDNKFIFDTKHIMCYSKIINYLKFLNTPSSSSKYTNSVISEKLNILDFKINEILKEVKDNAKI